MFSLLASLISYELEADDEQRWREQALAEAERLAVSRERLIGILGHDLRTPLTGILMSASALLRSDDLPERAHTRLSRIVASAERMGRMIGALLDFTHARLGAGLPIDPQPMDLALVCRQVAEEAQAAHPERTLHVTVTGDLRGTWDADRLSQALANLLENAVRYSPPGTAVTLEVFEYGEYVVIRVHNQGPPIPEPLLAEIFDPFRRGAVEHQGGPATGGLGLGLYVVHQIAVGHGGTVTADSSAAQGTTFTLHLPRTKAVPYQAADCVVPRVG